MKDHLLVFKPGVIHDGKPRVCPFSAQVVGYLAWFPQIRDTVDVTVAQANGHHYVEKTIEILLYLAATRDLPGPG